MTSINLGNDGIVVSTLNSTVAALGSGATFTGSGEQDNLAQVGCMVRTDNAGVLFFDFSSDGVNWDSVFPVGGFIVTPNEPEFHTAPKRGEYFRVRFVNGAGAQSFMRLTVYYGNSLDNSHIALEQPINTNADCSLIRPVASLDLDLARRNIIGQRAFFFFGHNLNVGTSYEDIVPSSGNINWQTVSSKVAISSTNAADTSAGLGVRSVEIHGLDTTGADQEEIIATNGTTEVESVNDYVRITHMHNEMVGTYGGSHQGDVTCRVTSAGAKTGDILSMMTGDEGAVNSSVQYGYGEAQNGYTSVPLGKVLYITRIEVIPNVSNNKTVSVALYEREGILNISAPFDPRRVIWSAEEFDSPVIKEFKSHIKIKGLTDLYFRAKGSDASKVKVWCDYYLLDANAEGA